MIQIDRMKGLEKMNVVSPLAVQAYLKNRGWQKIESKRQEVAIFQKEWGGDFFEVILPKDRTLLDFQRAMLRVVETIAASEDRGVDALITDLLLPPADIIRFQLEQEKIENGTVPLKDGVNWIENVSKALLAAACDEVQPSSFHKRLTYKEASHFIKNCRLGQTELGSFVIPVICPLVIDSEEDSEIAFAKNKPLLAESFGRRVTTRLIKSLQKLKQKISDDEIDDYINVAESDRMSVNLMDALLHLKPSNSEGSLSIAATWSRNTQAPNILNKVSLSSDYFPYIEGIASSLRPAVEDIKGTFYGKVTALKAEAEPIHRNGGNIQFQFMHDDEIVRANIELSSMDYAKACDAHKNGTMVLVKGKLSRKKRAGDIDYTDFELLGD